MLLTVPPAIGSRKPADVLAQVRLAWRHRGLNVRTIATHAGGGVCGIPGMQAAKAAIRDRRRPRRRG
ncbi:MAG TPA: hypothetical protein VF838_08190 [Trebonia sp.]